MGTLWQDIHYSARMSVRSPGFTVTVVLILAVGIGVNTAMFSVVNAVMLRPWPYPEPHRLVTIWEEGVKMNEGFRARAHFPFLRDNNQVFESLAGYCWAGFYVTGIERSRLVSGCDVTSNFFPMLGARPMLGRGFLPEDERSESARVVIVSHAFWQDDLGGSPDAIGKSICLTAGRSDGSESVENYTIVGVMPPRFSFFLERSVPVWRPLVWDDPGANAGPYPLPVWPLARLKTRVTLERADADLAVLAEHLHQLDPRVKTEGAKYAVHRLLDDFADGDRKLPPLLLGVTGGVLLIVCANVANLFLARATARQREVAVRLALGASRGRVMRQVFVESLLLSVSAGILGLVLVACTVTGLVRLCPSDIPRLRETSVDLSVFGFTLGASIISALLFGMVPAWRASDVGVSETLKQGAGQATTSRGRRRLHGGLVVAQLGLSLILLIGAALLIRSFLALESEHLGFRPQNMLAIGIRLPQTKYPQTSHCNAFFQPLLDQVRALPHVRSAAAFFNAESATDVLGSAKGETIFSILGQADSSSGHSAKWVSVTPDFFETMGIRFLKGQTPTDQDPDAVVIDETLARGCFPEIDPLGQTLVTDDSPGHNVHTIVGIVDTVRDFDVLNPVQGVVYARGSNFSGSAVLLARTEGDPRRLAPVVRMRVAEMEKEPVIRTLEPLAVSLAQMLAPRRFVTILLSLFAGVALSLAATGLYGLLQYGAVQRTHEFGIRLALGARRGDLLRAALAQGLKLTLIGVVLGLAGAAVLTRVIASFLYGVTRTDPMAWVCASLILSAVALGASYLPARRAARIEPMVALREE